MPIGWVYIMSNRPNGTLYTGVTSNLAARVRAHKDGTGSVFTARYRLHRLVYAEEHGDMPAAIQRETNVKRWNRAWKVRLIVAGNPDWDDLSIGLF